MNSLIKIVKNTKDNTFHPMFYFESPLPGNPDTLTRYKSKMHHTEGFETLKEAKTNSESDLKSKLEENGYSVELELEGVLQWDGEGIPTDIILKTKEATCPDNSK